MPSGQHGSPLSPLRIGTGGTPSSPSAIRAQLRTVMNSLRRLATDLAISGSSSGSGARPGGSEYTSAYDRSPERSQGRPHDTSRLAVIVTAAGAIVPGIARPAPSSRA